MPNYLIDFGWMKPLFKTILASALLIGCSSHPEEGTYSQTYNLSAKGDRKQLETIAVKRLEAYGIPSGDITITNPSKHHIDITIANISDTADFLPILSPRGNLKVQETYDNSEMYGHLAAIGNWFESKKDSNYAELRAQLQLNPTSDDSLLFRDSLILWRIIGPNMKETPDGYLLNPGSIAGYVHVTDTVIASSLLDLGNKAVPFPENIIYLYKASPQEEIMELHTLRNFVYPSMNTGHIEQSTAQEDGILTLFLDHIAGFEFSEMAKKNQGRSVAFLMDGELIASVQIGEKITGNGISIPGIAHARTLSAIISGGTYPEPVIVKRIK